MLGALEGLKVSSGIDHQAGLADHRAGGGSVRRDDWNRTGAAGTLGSTGLNPVSMAPLPPFPDIVAAAREGADWAWRELLGAVGPPILAYARSQGVDDPEDLLGQVLEGLVRGIPRFEGDESDFRSWSFTIARSRIIDHRRRVRRRPQRVDRPVTDRPAPDSDPAVSSGRLEREHVLAQLEDLPRAQREVIALRLVAGLSVDETARVLGRRAGAVRVATHRGLERLRRTSSGEE